MEEQDPASVLDEKDEEDEADDSDDENQNVFYKPSELIVSLKIIAVTEQFEFSSSQRVYNANGWEVMVKHTS